MTQQRNRETRASVCLAYRGVFVVTAIVALAAGCARSSSTPDASASEGNSSTMNDSARGAVKEAPVTEPAVATIDWTKHAPGDIFEATEAAANYQVVGQSTGGSIPNAAMFEIEVPSAVAVPTSFVAVAPGSASNAASSSPTTTGQRKSNIALPSGFVVSPNTEMLDGLPTRLRNSVDGSELALVPEGVFTLGTNSGPANAQPVTTMTLDAFYIGVTEVRIAQYVDAKKRIAAKGILLSDPTNSASPPDHPVLGVPWIDAKNYAASIGCELPTEAQWEKAARGPGGFMSPWGNSRPLWTEPRTITQIDSVQRHAEDRSVFGVYDLAGNALEWTADLYQDDAFKSLAQVPFERRRNWTGPKTSSGASLRVVKGGDDQWFVFARRGVRMTDKHPQIGFRVVLNLPTK